MKSSDSSCASAAVCQTLRDGRCLALGLATSGAYAGECRRPRTLKSSEEIVVTAQLREETLQSVPISAQVIQGDALQRLNLNSLSE